MTDEDKSYSYIKYPTFDGTQKSWPADRTLMESYMAQKSLDYLVGQEKANPKLPVYEYDIQFLAALAQRKRVTFLAI